MYWKNFETFYAPELAMVVIGDLERTFGQFTQEKRVRLVVERGEQGWLFGERAEAEEAGVGDPGCFEAEKGEG